MDERAVMMTQLLRVFTDGEGDVSKIFYAADAALAVGREISAGEIGTASGRDFHALITEALRETQFFMLQLRSTVPRSTEHSLEDDRKALEVCFLALSAGAADLYGGLSGPAQVRVDLTYPLNKATWQPDVLTATFSPECATVCGALLRGDYKRDPAMARGKLMTVLAVMWHEAIHTVNRARGAEMLDDWWSGADLPGGSTFREGVTAFATARDLKPMLTKLHWDKFADGLLDVPVPLVDYVPHTEWVKRMLVALGQKNGAGPDDFVGPALRRSCAADSLVELGRRFARHRTGDELSDSAAATVGAALAAPLVDLGRLWDSRERPNTSEEVRLGRTLASASIESGDGALVGLGHSPTTSRGAQQG